MPTPVHPAALGETVACSTQELVVQCAALGGAPTVGDVVVAGGTIAVVLVAETGPTDPSRRTVALGLDGADVAGDHPELALLLRSTFRARPVLDRAGGAPEALAPLHAPVRAADGDELRLLARATHLHRLADQPADVLVAHVRRVCPDQPARVAAGRALVVALAEDPAKLRLVLDRLSTLV